MPHFSLGVPSFSPWEDKQKRNKCGSSGTSNIKKRGVKKKDSGRKDVSKKINRSAVVRGKNLDTLEILYHFYSCEIIITPKFYTITCVNIQEIQECVVYPKKNPISVEPWTKCTVLGVQYYPHQEILPPKDLLPSDSRQTDITHYLVTLWFFFLFSFFNSSKWIFGTQSCCAHCQAGPLKCNKGHSAWCCILTGVGPHRGWEKISH